MEEKPLIINKEFIKPIAKKIVEMGIDFGAPYGPNFWIFTISPNGRIILPTKKTKGHPQMADKLIYPKDPILTMMAEHYYGKDVKDIHSLGKSYFMIFYGYINLDGKYFSDDYLHSTLFYSSLAIDPSKVYINECDSKVSEIIDTNNPHHCEHKQIELSKYVVFMKKRIFSLLEKYNLNENQIEELLQKLGKTKTEFLDEIEEQYKKEQRKKEEQEGPNDR